MLCPSCGAEHPAGANFCSACGARFARAVAEPLRKEAVKILDAGDRILFSAARVEDIEAVLGGYLERGSRLVTSPCLVGNSWVAACTIPPKAKTLDDTQTLQFADIASKAQAAPEELLDGCRVEELGMKRIVYGPSLLAVKLRLEHLKHFGVEVVGDIEQAGDEWVAVCDLGGAGNTGYRW